MRGFGLFLEFSQSLIAILMAGVGAYYSNDSTTDLYFTDDAKSNQYFSQDQ